MANTFVHCLEPKEKDLLFAEPSTKKKLCTGAKY